MLTWACRKIMGLPASAIAKATVAVLFSNPLGCVANETHRDGGGMSQHHEWSGILYDDPLRSVTDRDAANVPCDECRRNGDHGLRSPLWGSIYHPRDRERPASSAGLFLPGVANLSRAAGSDIFGSDPCVPARLRFMVHEERATRAAARVRLYGR